MNYKLMLLEYPRNPQCGKKVGELSHRPYAVDRHHAKRSRHTLALWPFRFPTFRVSTSSLQFTSDAEDQTPSHITLCDFDYY